MYLEDKIGNSERGTLSFTELEKTAFSGLHGYQIHQTGGEGRRNL
jgi:hypothetical protein